MKVSKHILLLFLTIWGLPIHGQDPVLKNPVMVEKLSTNYVFLEGPLWSEGNGLYFSDQNASKTYFYDPVQKTASLYLSNTGSGNGLAYDKNGAMLMAQSGNRALSRVENGTIKVLVSTYTNKKLNSPNDIAVRANGIIFFTDPPYGITNAQKELGFSGIYSFNPNTGKLTLLDKSLANPNGIAFSPNEKKLYVNDSEVRTIWSWDVVNDTTLSNKQLFYTMSPAGNTDGMKVDPNGFLYCTGPSGVWVFAPDKTLITTLLVPEKATNCAFGDADKKSLYVTSGVSLYRVRNQIVTDLASDLLEKKENSLDCYPNPMGQNISLSFRLHSNDKVKLEILKVTGEVIVTLLDGTVTAGMHTYEWSSQGNKGMYLVRLSSSEKVIQRKLVVE
jgi:gluconolactonase